MCRFGLLFVVGLLLVAACDRPPSERNAREWRAEDHDRLEEAPRAEARGQPEGEQDGHALLARFWVDQCARCHGPTGKGDGPEGAANKTPDMTSATWQASANDARLFTSIKQGKGAMPKFELPDPIVRVIVDYVRHLAVK